jgi:hypothetical protein
VRRYRDVVARVLNLPDIRDRLIGEAYEIHGNTPEEFSALQKREVEMYRRIILESGMTRL